MDLFETNEQVLITISNKMNFDVNVLGFEVLDWIFSNLDSSIIVKKNIGVSRKFKP